MLGKVMLFLCCSGIGFAAAEKTHCRQQQLRLSADFIRTLISRLEFSMKPAGKLVEELAQQSAFRKLGYLWAFQNDQKYPFAQNWKKTVAQNQGEFTDSDKTLLLCVGDILGAYDLDAQKKELEHLAKELEQSASELTQEAERNRNLYTALGPLCGIALGILL